MKVKAKKTSLGLTKDKEYEVIEDQDKLNRYLIIRDSGKLASRTKNLFYNVSDGEKQDDK